MAASRELVQLYWQIGREIVRRQEREGWGKAIVDRLATDIQRTFPGIAGFSVRNIWRMRAFYLAYNPEVVILPQAAAESDGADLPQAAAGIPWFHNVVLIEKLKNPTQRLWYAEKVVQHGWSRAVLVHQIELDLYGREGRAITNFPETLSPAAVPIWHSKPLRTLTSSTSCFAKCATRSRWNTLCATPASPWRLEIPVDRRFAPQAEVQLADDRATGGRTERHSTEGPPL